MNENLFELLAEGKWMHASARDIPEASVRLQHAAILCHNLNMLSPAETEQRQKILGELLGSIGEEVVINTPFRCDFGYNIHIGDRAICNFNLTILDEAPVYIGNNVMIGPNCTLATITHAMLPEQRNDGIMRACPIKICDNAWIASNVVILPGVTIGEGAVIGAGSVVTKSVPDGVFAAGNPCRVIRAISADRDFVTPVI